MLSPFMVAMAPETTAQQPQAPAAIYNWENQGEMTIVDEEGLNMGLRASSSHCAGQYQIDDWNLC